LQRYSSSPAEPPAEGVGKGVSTMKTAVVGAVAAVVLGLAGLLFLGLCFVLQERALELAAWGVGSLGAGAFFAVRAFDRVWPVATDSRDR
jgi:hypothetical protein